MTMMMSDSMETRQEGTEALGRQGCMSKYNKTYGSHGDAPS